MELIVFDLNQIRILINIALAMLFGAFIGLDREAANKPAGLRTHMLVAGAAAFLVAMGDVVVRQFNAAVGTSLLQADPVRIVEAVITGVSFLGAGTIIRNSAGGDVRGLTTAASLLFAAAVGIGVALYQWLLVLGATMLVLGTLRILPIVSRWLSRYWKKDSLE